MCRLVHRLRMRNVKAILRKGSRRGWKKQLSERNTSLRSQNSIFFFSRSSAHFGCRFVFRLRREPGRINSEKMERVVPFKLDDSSGRVVHKRPRNRNTEVYNFVKEFQVYVPRA